MAVYRVYLGPYGRVQVPRAGTHGVLPGWVPRAGTPWRTTRVCYLGRYPVSVVLPGLYLGRYPVSVVLPLYLGRYPVSVVPAYFSNADELPGYVQDPTPRRCQSTA